MPHATRGRDGRQEGRECGYYYLHRNLNHSLLHSSLFTIHFSLFTSSLLRLVFIEASTSIAAFATGVDHEA